MTYQWGVQPEDLKYPSSYSEPVPPFWKQIPLGNSSHEGFQSPISSQSSALDCFGPLDGFDMASSLNNNTIASTLDPHIDYSATTEGWANNPIAAFDNSLSQYIPNQTLLFNNTMKTRSQLESDLPHRGTYFEPTVRSNPFPLQMMAHLMPKTHSIDSWEQFGMTEASMDLETFYPELYHQDMIDTSMGSPSNSHSSWHAQNQPHLDFRNPRGRPPKKCIEVYRDRPFRIPEASHRCNFEGCEKRFVRQEHLKRHEKTHYSSDVYNCPLCAKPFSRFDNLMAHVKLHDNGSPDKPSRRTKYFSETAAVIRELCQTRRKTTCPKKSTRTLTKE